MSSEESISKLFWEYIDLIDKVVDERFADEVIAEQLNIALTKFDRKRNARGSHKRPRSAVFRCGGDRKSDASCDGTRL